MAPWATVEIKVTEDGKRVYLKAPNTQDLEVDMPLWDESKLEELIVSIYIFKVKD